MSIYSVFPPEKWVYTEISPPEKWVYTEFSPRKSKYVSYIIVVKSLSILPLKVVVSYTIVVKCLSRIPFKMVVSNTIVALVFIQIIV
jgi:hypothetical protein